MAIETEHRLRLGVEIRKQLREFPLDVSFTAAKGCMGILGSSGCGKSMTLKSIAGGALLYSMPREKRREEECFMILL